MLIIHVFILNYYNFMKQFPSNLKFKKYHKINKSFLMLKNQKFFLPKFGFFGLKALYPGKLTFNQIESARRARSEEHTSELQSLMRISYAVFCLKKKTK